MTRDELLEALLLERQDQTWWRHKPPPRKATEPALPLLPEGHLDNSDVTVARRRRELLAAVDHTEIKEEESA